jgi:hypothetical protein
VPSGRRREGSDVRSAKTEGERKAKGAGEARREKVGQEDRFGSGKVGVQDKAIRGRGGRRSNLEDDDGMRDLKWKGQSRGKAQKKRSRVRDAIAVNTIEGINNVVTKA